MQFDVIRDTQEKKNFWLFSNHRVVANVIDQKLPTGDYTIVGLEDKLCIERKHTVSELAKNITEDRFVRELERMSKFKYSYLILEFSLEEIYSYPFIASVPYSVRKKAKIRGPFIFKKLADIAVQYNIHIVPCEHPKYAEEFVVALMKRIYEQEF